MNKLLIGILSITILFSCTGIVENQKQEVSLDKNTNPLSDPTIFIGNHKAKAMILGVFHFANPGLDEYKPKYEFNILDSIRQVELNDLLDKIAKFSPTKILIEWNRIDSDSIANDKYQKYLKGEFNIENQHNEVYQIGFKLAKKLGQKKIYCSDASAKWFGVELDWDNYNEEEYLKSQGQYTKAKRYDYNSFYEHLDSMKTTQSLTEHLIMMNDPDNRLKDHQAYLTSIIEGAGDNYLGADAVARWYRRNLRIFANAYDLTNFDNEERLLLVYGAGHVWQLRQFFTDSPDFDYIEVNDYLIE